MLVENDNVFDAIGPSVARFGKENQVLIIWFSMVVIMLYYSGVSVFGCLNTYRYIIKQKRYRNLPLLLFYLFAILACAARVGRYAAMMYAYSS